MKVNQEPSDGFVIPGATNLEELAKQPDPPEDEQESPEPIAEDDDLGPAEDDLQSDPGDETDEEVDEPETRSTPPQSVSPEEATRQAIAYLQSQGIQVPQNAPVAEAEDDDPEPDRWDNDGVDHDQWLIRQALKQMAPVMAPQVQTQVVSVVKDKIERLGMSVTPEMESMIASQAKAASMDNLRSVLSDSGELLKVAASYVEYFRANPSKEVPKAQKAPPAQVVVKGVASAPAGTSKASAESVSIPREFAPHYKKFVSQFKLKDTNSQRKDYLESIGYRG